MASWLGRARNDGRRGGRLAVLRDRIAVLRARAVGRDGRHGQVRGGRVRRGRSGEDGYTILEILVVVTIIGLLIGLVAPAALRQLGGARDSVAKQSVERLSTVLDLYNLDIGSYPTTEQGLKALVSKPAGVNNWNGPYLKGEGVPTDPWGRDYVYRQPSERPGHDYDLCSKGSSGEGGDDAICNP